MAFNLGNTSPGGRSRYRGSGMLSDINVIPLVDVVLVLLIIFMLTAHVMEYGLEVDVPKVSTTRESTKDLPVITVTRDGDMMLNDRPVNINDLGPQIRARFKNATAVYVRADKGVTWDPLANVVAALGDAHFTVNMVTQPADEARAKR